jgi:alpha-tubulin suppressor-like RCC1 family protein
MKNKTIAFILVVIAFIFAGSCTAQPPVPESLAPAPAPRPEASYRVQDIFAGTSNIFLLMKDGTLWASGYNFFGQLGFGNAATDSAVAPFTEIKSSGVDFSEVQAITGGESFTVIYKNDGTLYGVGVSSYGELGLGASGDGKLPAFTQLKNENGSAIDGIRAVEAGNNSVFLIKNDGTLWASGYNYYGELGLGDSNNRAVFTQVTSAGSNVKDVVAGARHTVILKTDNTVWTTGYNSMGQLGLGNQNDTYTFTQVSGIRDVAQIAAGNYHTVILRNDGTVWTAGDNFYGQLGRSNERQYQFAQAVDSQGRVINDATNIVANGELTLILRRDGSLYMAGNLAEPVFDSDSAVPDEEATTGFGFTALGPGNNNSNSFSSITKAVVGLRNIYVITDDGRIWAAGSNEYGQMRVDYDDTDDSLVLVPVISH